MYSNDDGEDDGRVSTSEALRHVLIFQLKLAADALRDFLLSPLSLIAFGIDAVTRPKVEHSLYLRLMLLGRRSDRMINLFDDHADSGEFTIDRAVDEVEEILRTSQGDGQSQSTPVDPKEVALRRRASKESSAD